MRECLHCKTDICEKYTEEHMLVDKFKIVEKPNIKCMNLGINWLSV